MRKFVSLALLGCLASAAVLAREPKPAEHCLDAREMLRSVRVTPLLVTVATANGAYRLDLAARCDMPAEAEVAVLAQDGWVCGGGKEYLRGGGLICPIKQVRPIALAEYTRLAQVAAELGGRPATTTLDAVEVIGNSQSQRGFAASSEYCVDPQYIRSWSEAGNAVIVETSPQRAGGNRRYRLEFSGSCRDLTRAKSIQLRSGVGIGLICGNPGDNLIVLDEVGGSSESLPVQDSSGGFYKPLVSRASGAGCAISAVFPVDG